MMLWVSPFLAKAKQISSTYAGAYSGEKTQLGFRALQVPWSAENANDMPEKTLPQHTPNLVSHFSVPVST